MRKFYSLRRSRILASFKSAWPSSPQYKGVPFAEDMMDGDKANFEHLWMGEFEIGNPEGKVQREDVVPNVGWTTDKKVLVSLR